MLKTSRMKRLVNQIFKKRLVWNVLWTKYVKNILYEASCEPNVLKQKQIRRNKIQSV